MNIKLPAFIEIYRQLIAAPSISSTEAESDQSNETVINLLATWFETLGFDVEVQPVPAVCCCAATPIPSRLMKAAGAKIPSP